MNEMSCSGGPCPLILRILAAARSLEVRVEAALAPLDLSLAKFGVLHHLTASEEPIALGALAERNSCVKSNMTQLVDRLQADGLVARVSDPADRRSVRAEITPRGRQLYRQAVEVLTAQEQLLVGRLDGSTEELESSLRHLTAR